MASLLPEELERSQGPDDSSESIAAPSHPAVKAASDGSGSSQSSQDSPTLSPSQNPAMTNSMISNLDLGNEDEGQRDDTRGVMRSQEGGEIASITPAEEANGKLNTYIPATSTSASSNGRTVPLAPRDVLGQSGSTAAPSSSASTSRTPLMASSSAFDETCSGADDSALDALMEAHQKDHSADSVASPPSSTMSHNIYHKATTASDLTPSKRDASFGLDPDADTTQSIKGKPFRLTPSLAAATGSSSSSSSSSSHHHHLHRSHSKSSAHLDGGDGEDSSDHHSHSTAATEGHETMKTGSEHTQTVPSVSATGMPRFLPRHRRPRSASSSSAGSVSQHSSHSSHAPAPKEMMPQYPPSGSLTLAIFSRDISWRRRAYLLVASLAINVGLPFVNGVMLGFGEIFARTIVAPYIGLAPGAININAPGPSNNKLATATTVSANTGGAGLRYAGVGGTGQMRGGGAGGRDGAAVSIESWEVDAGQRGRGRRAA